MDVSLEKKLMIHKFPRILLSGKPRDLKDLDGLVCDTKASGTYNLVIAFVFSLDEMEQCIARISGKGLLEDQGYLYIAYPKKGNKQYREYIDRDSIFPRLGVDESTGFVRDAPMKFSKMVALNDTFTIVGLKYLPSGDPVKTRVSANVDDYIENIPALRSYLKHKPEILAVYDALSYGYRKDWARYVYSARTSATTEKRLSEMVDILKEGYKSINLYKQRKK